MKHSIRNIAASASEFVEFATKAAADQSLALSDGARQSLTHLSERISAEITMAARTRKGNDSLTLHKQWQEAQAPQLCALCKEAKTLLVENQAALKDFVVNERMPERDRLRAGKLISAMDNIILSENSTAGRDAGAYWQDPLMGIEVESHVEHA